MVNPKISKGTDIVRFNILYLSSFIVSLNRQRAYHYYIKIIKRILQESVLSPIYLSMPDNEQSNTLRKIFNLKFVLSYNAALASTLRQNNGVGTGN